MRERTRIAIIAALLGAIALWWLFPRYDRSAGLGQFHISRHQAIARAREVARANGIDATGWLPAVQSDERRSGEWIYLWRRLHPGSPVFDALVTPHVARVTLRQPDGERFVNVTFTSEGRLVGFDAVARKPFPMGDGQPTETLDAMASGVLAQYLGEHARLFHQVNRGVTQGSNLLYSWEYSDPADSPHLLRFEVSFHEQRLVRAELTAEPVESFRAAARALRTPQSYVLALMLVLDFALIALAFPSFFRALVRHRLSHRRLATMALLAAGLIVVALWGGSWLDGARAESARRFSGTLNPIAGHTFVLFIIGCALVLFYGGGRGLLLPQHHHRWLALEALLARRFTIRPIGAALVHGVLSGVALAALPLLLAPVFLPAQPVLGQSSSLLASSPVAALAEPFILIDVMAIVLLVLPLSRRLGPPWLIVPLCAVLITANWFGTRAPFGDWIVPGLCASFLFALGIGLVEIEFGALAALVAGVAMLSTWNASAYWVQPVAELSQSGWWAAAPVLAMGVAGLLVMRFGVPVDQDAEVAALCAESANDVLSQRDRLSSEFDVARRAQQAMLPLVPANLGAASLAATCIPARDVGGDLYDFYPTSDGRYAIGVADVSGKGVPASLYMTLTKGFLAAAGSDSNDLLSTLSQLNTHLYLAGKRKIFVTMALAFFSPDGRRITLARAGHNSPLWRRTGLGRSEYLTPPGMGLGLTSRLLFERALQLEEIELEPGDAFVLYSDGITEAMNEEREQFGEDRLQSVVDGCDGCDAPSTERAILDAVRAFIGQAPPHDDMTLFVVRV